MTKEIEKFISLTGWSGSGGASAYALNEIDEYLSGYQTKSVIFKFDGLGGYVQKTLSVDLTGYDVIVFYAYSTKKGKDDYKTVDDFNYKINFGGVDYYMPVYSSWSPVVICVTGATALTKIKITALHGDEDYLFMSYMVANKEELPLDLLEGLKSGLNNYITREIDAIYLGSKSAVNVDDDQIDLSSFDYLDNNAVIKIDDGVNSEIHQLKDNAEGIYKFSGLYDGKKIKSAYAHADVYLYIPVEFGRRNQLEILIPGIVIWGLLPERASISGEIEKTLDTWSDDGAMEKQEGLLIRFNLLLDAEARSDYILNYVSSIIRSFIARKKIYCGGLKFDVDFDGIATEIEPTESFDIIPKIQYPIKMSVRSDVWRRKQLYKTTTQTTTVGAM